MVLGKKDKDHVAELEKQARDHKSAFAREFILYLHEEYEATYKDIADLFGCSQQYVNNIALGKQQLKNETFFDTLIEILDK